MITAIIIIMIIMMIIIMTIMISPRAEVAPAAVREGEAEARRRFRLV